MESFSSAMIDAIFWAVILAVVVAVYARFFSPAEMTKAPGDAGILVSREACACAAHPELASLLVGFRHSLTLAMGHFLASEALPPVSYMAVFFVVASSLSCLLF